MRKNAHILWEQGCGRAVEKCHKLMIYRNKALSAYFLSKTCAAGPALAVHTLPDTAQACIKGKTPTPSGSKGVGGLWKSQASA
jgi:hypothetical protein